MLGSSSLYVFRARARARTIRARALKKIELELEPTKNGRARLELDSLTPLPTPILAPFGRRPHHNHRLPTSSSSSSTTGMKANSSRIDSTGRKTSSIRCYSALTPELKTTLDKVVASHKVVVFIKGTKELPQCGFSNTVVQILKSFECAF
ncbi:UNVERIFIED_CONTAM: Monothiol glutaredoxin-S7, chloroplastic [Sesamum latifolium]|uniref:Monothiol glutaredoxin-S7, chloroplastic n=1 Tax=Sesamum latifolium TaxID=2727402 RepID=A0AAW2Y6G1_9LAMI